MEPTPPATAVQDALEGISYPARKADLLEHARGADASPAVLSELERLPDGMTFSSRTEVTMRIKEHAERAG